MLQDIMAIKNKKTIFNNNQITDQYWGGGGVNSIPCDLTKQVQTKTRRLIAEDSDDFG